MSQENVGVATQAIEAEMSKQHSAEFIAAIGTTAVVLLGLNSVAASSAPMLRFVVAIGVAAGVVALMRLAGNSGGGGAQ